MYFKAIVVLLSFHCIVFIVEACDSESPLHVCTVESNVMAFSYKIMKFTQIHSTFSIGYDEKGRISYRYCAKGSFCAGAAARFELTTICCEPTAVQKFQTNNKFIVSTLIYLPQTLSTIQTFTK